MVAHGQTGEPASSEPPAPGLQPAAAAAAPTRTAAAPLPTDGQKAQPSALTAELFYEILVGELAAGSDDPGSGYGLMLDAARQTRDPRLFQRAVEMTLRARAGEAALQAARAWKQTLPNSRDAGRAELQILIALNRISETVAPLRAELAAASEVEQPALMGAILRSYGRASNKKLAAEVVEQALADDLKNPKTAALAWTTVGRMRLMAGDASGALDAARKGQEADAAADGPPALAIDLIGPFQPLAEPIVTRYLAGTKPSPALRMAYGRALAEQGRYGDATTAFMAVTAAEPALADAWLLLGTLQLQTRHDAEAQASLKQYVELASGEPASDQHQRGLTQAYFMLSQAAERRKDFPDAERWLSHIDSPTDLAAVQIRRATLLAHQGKLAQARDLLHGLPDGSDAEKRQKFQAEVQLLRDARQYQAAYDMLAHASAAAPTDADLIYDQAMVAEKLDHFDDMERLLRRLIVLKPDNQNAYNALGYSMADRNVKLDEARTLIQKATQLAPEDPFIADSLGWVEFRLGNLAEAARILEDAYKRRPDPEIGAHLGEVLFTSGQRQRALAIWKEAKQADAGNETLQETFKRLGVKP